MFEGTEDEVEEWYGARRRFTDVIAAWEDGKTIQFNSRYGWEDCYDNKPAWDINGQYRIKPEGLKWTDLKIGDVIRSEGMSWMVTGIDARNDTNLHIYFNGNWYGDFELKDFEKVE